MSKTATGAMKSMVKNFYTNRRLKFREPWKIARYIRNGRKKFENFADVPKTVPYFFSCMFCRYEHTKTHRQVARTMARNPRTGKIKVVAWAWICPGCEKELKNIKKNIAGS